VTCMLMAMWHVLTTVARQTPRDMFSVWSDPSLLHNNGKAAFSTGSVPRRQWGQPCFLCGLFPGYKLLSYVSQSRTLSGPQ
jgi:hypothetical protein